ncbi:MAG: tetratricopeptide repeat protein [Nitrospirae bacterium]|nr:tetratricopeptide repeat protein [Nitrospirota bacterium]
MRDDLSRARGIHILLILVLSLVVYSNTFNAPFHFDDFDYIVQNPLLKDPGYFIHPSKAGQVLVFDSLVNYTFRNRFVGFLTFAFNYMANGLEVTGYHVVNIAIHCVNSILVYWLFVLIFKAPFLSGGFSSIRDMGNQPAGTDNSPIEHNLIPFFSALFFACHPLQIEAVTYISQRFASLAAMFYLLSLCLYVLFRLGARTAGLGAAVLYLFSLVSAVLAMFTKEISFTLPVLLAAIEFFFFKGDKKKRIALLFPFYLTMLIIPLNALSLSSTGGDLLADAALAARAKTDILRSDYLFTQFSVIITYLRLLFFPAGQNFDYDYPVSHSLLTFSSLLPLLLLLGLFSCGVYLFCSSRRVRDYRIVSFGIFWFFITLSVESSFIPTNDLIYEHRMYLPSAGVFPGLITAAFMYGQSDRLRFQRFRESVTAVLLIAVILMAAAAYARNEVWSGETALWEDVIHKSPGKARGYNELGRVLYRQELTEAAISAYKKAIALKPDFAWAHNNLGLAYYKAGNVDEALREVRAASDLGLNSPEVLSNLGALYFKKGLTDEAIGAFLSGLLQAPGHAGLHLNLGVAYRAKGWEEKAEEHFRKAHELDPGRY